MLACVARRFVACAAGWIQDDLPLTKVRRLREGLPVGTDRSRQARARRPIDRGQIAGRDGLPVDTGRAGNAGTGPLSLIGAGSGAGVVGCCAKARPVSAEDFLEPGPRWTAARV